jgi:hypothetical protein
MARSSLSAGGSCLSAHGTVGGGNGHRLRRFGGAVLVSLTLLLALSSTASALPSKFFGFQFSAGYAQSPPDVEAMSKAGAKYLRINLNWGQKMQGDNEGKNGWAPFDQAFQYAWENGITVIPDLYGNLNAGPQRPWESDWAPQGSGWENWLYQVVQRYGYWGTFWNGKANPQPATIWEVWNEPNRGANGPDGVHPYPQEYGRFLKRSATTLREAQNKVAQEHGQSEAPITVLFGGLLTMATGWQNEGGVSRLNESVHDFLEEASKVSGLGETFNGLSLHPYAFGENVSAVVNQVATNVSTARENLTQFFSSGKSIWITELGWPVKPWGDPNHLGVDEQTQASLLTGSFNWIKEQQAAKNIQSLLFYFYRDVPGWEVWDGHTGLRDVAGNYRAAWRSYLEQTGASAWPPPTSVTTDASAIGETQATLNGTINPNSWETSYRFEYGTSTNYGTSIPVPNVPIGSGSTPVAKSATIANLQPNTHYHYRVVGTNPAGTTFGTDHSFTTGLKWHIRNSNSGGAPDSSFWFGLPGQVPVVGDWNGDGVETPGSYEPQTGTWRLRNSNSTGGSNVTFQYGGSQYRPVVGDWDGNGTTTIGLFEPKAGTWALRNSNSSGDANLSFQYGGSQYDPVTGDWDGNGTTTIGLYEPATGNWSLRNSNSGGSPSIPTFSYGGSQFWPLSGDWNGNGTTTIGLFEPKAGTWALRNSNNGGNPDIAFQYGGSQFEPAVADWDGNGTVTAALVTK